MLCSPRLMWSLVRTARIHTASRSARRRQRRSSSLRSGRSTLTPPPPSPNHAHKEPPAHSGHHPRTNADELTTIDPARPVPSAAALSGPVFGPDQRGLPDEPAPRHAVETTLRASPEKKRECEKFLYRIKGAATPPAGLRAAQGAVLARPHAPHGGDGVKSMQQTPDVDRVGSGREPAGAHPRAGQLATARAIRSFAHAIASSTLAMTSSPSAASA